MGIEALSVVVALAAGDGDWKSIESPQRLHVLWFQGGERSRPLAEVAAVRIERVHTEVAAPALRPLPAPSAPRSMRLCGSQAEYLARGGPIGSNGVLVREPPELLLFDASPSRKPDGDTFAAEGWREAILALAGA